MKFIADFHIHSKFSRATAKNLDLEHLYQAAQIKGITVIGTGDFTHPAWYAELKKKLIPAEEGVFALRPDIADHCDGQVPEKCRQPVRFILVTEISNIYKKGGSTRKNHNLVFLPDLDAAERFNHRLDKIGNIVSDGRPILGLDARDLLEIVLETSPKGFLIPAHIWTPWFSLLGSRSGFDTVKECFEDLTDHIFALETGLSSDPLMNWRVSELDRFSLISNSDAHSPSKLGREATIFDTQLGFDDIRHAIEYAEPNRFLGTLEFFPEQGKYHVDGHRRCHFYCHPRQTRELNELCPVCGKPMTLGVLYRVEMLADRPQGVHPPKARPYTSLIPLTDLLAEIFQTGVSAKRVDQAYHHLVTQYGSELSILQTIPIASFVSCTIPLLAEAIERMRLNQVHFEPGFDGEFGQVRLFNPEERERLKGQRELFCAPDSAGPIYSPPEFFNKTLVQKAQVTQSVYQTNTIQVLNAEQQAAVTHSSGPLMIVAGPGTGKTRTITCRMTALMTEHGIDPEKILAVTFTQKAAREMQQRIGAGIPRPIKPPLITTFHGLCWQLIKATPGQEQSAIVDDSDRLVLLEDAIRQTQSQGRRLSLSAQQFSEHISHAKQNLLLPSDDLSNLLPNAERDQVIAVYTAYQGILAFQRLFDFEDLVVRTVRQLNGNDSLRNQLQRRFAYIFVDEFQDINFGQYGLIRSLATPSANICVIGDPNQSIYGFRGSDIVYFEKFRADYPSVRTIQLTRNYRSTEIILSASHQVIQNNQGQGQPMGHIKLYSNIKGHPTITMIETASVRDEAVVIGKTIEQMMGGIGFHSLDFGKVDSTHAAERSLSDFAVLYRTRHQGNALADILLQAGIPCQITNSKAQREDPMVSKLMAVLRAMTGQAAYSDLLHLCDLATPAVSKETLQLFKTWAYTRQLPLSAALQTALRLPVPGLSIVRQQRLVAMIRLLEQLNQACLVFSVAEAIAYVISHTSLTSHFDDDLLARIIDQADCFERDLNSFISGQTLQSDTDLFQPNVEKVALLTMHAAKGLEFPVVFVAGCEDGLIPYNRSMEVATDIDEERRLFYVAMTRAREQLFLTMAKNRTLYGKTLIRYPSPFLEEMDALVRQKSSGKPGKPNQQQLSLF